TLRRRTNGREVADSIKPDRKKTSEDSGVTVSQRSCWTVLSFWLKVLLFIIITPAFLNYASLQREGQVLSSISPYALLYQLSHKDVLFFQIKVCTCDRVGLGFSRRSLQAEKVWGISTTRRYESVDDLHRLVKAADIAKPFILIGSELGTLNNRFYSHIHDSQVSDLVLIDPIPEDVFEEEKWQQYSYLVPSLQMMQFSAAVGLSRLLIILGVLKPVFQRGDVSEELLQRQKYLLYEHFFLKRAEISRYKLLSSKTSVHVITGESFDDQLPSDLNQVVAELQRKFLERSYPNANHIQIRGADRHMIYKNPSSQSNQQTQ
uniref:Si:dkey-122a22.2 n=1 Tax=Cyprinus carpio carpio TaxID=630221 RepID=A0A9J7XAX5_CYPCA